MIDTGNDSSPLSLYVYGFRDTRLLVYVTREVGFKHYNPLAAVTPSEVIRVNLVGFDSQNSLDALIEQNLTEVAEHNMSGWRG